MTMPRLVSALAATAVAVVGCVPAEPVEASRDDCLRAIGRQATAYMPTTAAAASSEAVTARHCCSEMTFGLGEG